ncbi:AraC family transcriptional regulator [Tsukamurella ocularis]|uniref:AraC family transcriptional regulator n=1 Tax=Tsukamurella ocularis TaxID=1970234 RepID=UPI0039EF9AE8
MERGSPETGAAGPCDWDEAREVVSDAYFAHDLVPLTRATADNVCVDCVTLGPVRIAHIGWGAEVSVSTDHPGGYAVNVPLDGYLESVTGSENVRATPASAAIYRPDTPTRITRWSQSCTILGIRFDRDYLHHERSRILPGTTAHLPTSLDTATEAGAGWVSLAQSLAGQLRENAWVLQNERVAHQFASALTTAFLVAALPEEESGAPVPRPRIVKRVIDRIHADPGRAWTAADMAEAAGVSVRRLQEGFRLYVGVSPREYLLDVRLDRAHHDLVRASPMDTVADVAMRWGFHHTGRFAAAYRRRYGVAPSATRRG